MAASCPAITGDDTRRLMVKFDGMMTSADRQSRYQTMTRLLTRIFRRLDRFLYTISWYTGRPVYVLSLKEQWDQPDAVVTLRRLHMDEKSMGNKRVAILFTKKRSA